MFGSPNLTPLEQQIIPRLELCATVLAVQADGYLRAELEMQLTDWVFWTDSTLVLQYITNTKKKFRTFVVNMVTIIRGLLHPEHWQPLVSTARNPADEATRSLSAQDMVRESKLITGPPFLRQEEARWPKGSKMIGGLLTDPEVLYYMFFIDGHQLRIQCRCRHLCHDQVVDALFLMATPPESSCLANKVL